MSRVSRYTKKNDGLKTSTESIPINGDYNLSRDTLVKKLKKEGIETRPFFYPIHFMPPYKTGENFPVAEDLSKRGINLPSSAKLREGEIKRIAETIKSIMKSLASGTKYR